MADFVKTAEAAWGKPLHDWVRVLAEQCNGSTQSAVAKRLGYSAGLISQVLRKTYPGNVNAVEEAVRGAWMGSTLECPVMGTIGSDVCLGWRRKAKTFAPTNSHRVRMYRACNNCPHNEKGDPK